MIGDGAMEGLLPAVGSRRVPELGQIPRHVMRPRHDISTVHRCRKCEIYFSLCLAMSTLLPS